MFASIFLDAVTVDCFYTYYCQNHAVNNSSAKESATTAVKRGEYYIKLKKSRNS